MRSSRTPGPESGRAATAPIEDCPIPGALLTLRLVNSADESEALVWEQGTAVGCLASDVIGASGGAAVDAHGPFLMARFAAVYPACLAIRRLQWAMQGFAESNPVPLAIAAMVQTGEDTSSGSNATTFETLEKTRPGKVLISSSAGKLLEESPGFAIRAIAEGATELVWRAADEQASRAADERVLARFIRENHGEAAQEPERRPVEPKTTTIAAPAAGDTYLPDSKPRRRNLIWPVGIAAMAILVVGGYFLMGRAYKPSGAGAETTATSQPQALSGGAVENKVSGPQKSSESQVEVARPQAAGQTNVVDSDRKLTRREKAKLAAQERAAAQTPTQQNQQQNDQQEPPRVVPKAPQQEPARVVAETPRGDCQYQPDQIPGLLARAESSRSRGQYQDAKRKFASVLACDRGNRRAEEGLQQVLQALRTQGSDDQ